MSYVGPVTKEILDAVIIEVKKRKTKKKLQNILLILLVTNY